MNLKIEELKKKYLALTCGIPSNNIGQINYPIMKKKYGITLESMARGVSSEQKAITLFSILRKLPHDIGLLDLQPITGRKHQIRIHLSHIGCPIVGDVRYGKACKNISNDYLQLHAYFLSINIDGKEVSVTVPMPQYMRDVILELENLS